MDNKESYNYFLFKYSNELYLIAEYIIDNNYYSAQFAISENHLEVSHLEAEKYKIKKANYNFNTNNVCFQKGCIQIDMDIDIKFDFGDKINFRLNEEFDRNKDVFESNDMYFENADIPFAIRYINVLIKSGQIYASSEFIYDNIEDIFNLTRAIEKIHISKGTHKLKKEFTPDEIVNYTQDFLNNLNIDINVRQLLESGTIKMYDLDTYQKNETGEISSGKSYFDKKEKKKLIKLINFSDIHTLAVLIHEIFHYHNQPSDNKRTIVSDFLTEVVSYGLELIFLDSLAEYDFKEDAEGFSLIIASTLLKLSYLSYSPELSLVLYKKNGEITEEAVSEYIEVECYIEEMKHFVQSKKNLRSNTWNIIGQFLGIYCFIEYKKNPSFLEKILKLDSSINTKNMEECLKIIGLYSKSEILSKGTENLEEFIRRYEYNQKMTKL